MNAISFLISPLASMLGGRPAAPAAPIPPDQNDPADRLDLLGTVCDVHGCQRQLDEAPVVEPHPRGDVVMAKRELFPNSWKAIASHATPSRGNWFQRSHRPKMVAVRYCEKCRAAAEQWMREHGIE